MSLAIENVPWSDLKPHPQNPRNGDTDAIAESVRVNGVYRPVIVARDTILAGHHLYHALGELGHEQVDIVRLDIDPDSPEAIRIMLSDNRTADLGTYDHAQLADLLRLMNETETGTLGTGYQPDYLDHLDFLATQTLDGIARQAEIEAGAAQTPRLRSLPLRLVLSDSHPSLATLLCAGRLGWVPGVLSTQITSVRNYKTRYPRAAPVAFMDNPYRDYVHSEHVAAVAETQPVSCTTRDLFTAQQAAEQDIDFYSIEETLEQAAELAEHVEEIILIPKFDCLDRLPERIGKAQVVLGYSVQSSYGGTELPIEAFKGRPVHLLGGSWAKQRAYLNLLGDDIISLDNNNILRVAGFGQVCRGDGTSTSLTDMLGRQQWSVYFAAMVLSLTEIATAVKEDFGVDLTSYDVEEANDGPRDTTDAGWVRDE